tara:strand:- start:102 stop:773 length:672 start_codon:yes stop_codon:yes gene_type:complete
MAGGETVASLAPSLEPIAGAGFALCVGYLNLARFRYRSKIREVARNYLSGLETQDGYEDHSHWPSVDLLSRLANLPDYDPIGDKVSSSGIAVPTGDAVKADRSISEIVYDFVFSHHLDRHLCLILSAYALFVLQAGTTHLNGHQWLAPVALFGPNSYGIHASLLILACLAPPSLSLIAWVIISQLKSIAHKASQIVSKGIENKAMRASLPDLNSIRITPSTDR